MRIRAALKYLLHGPLNIGRGSFPYERSQVFFPRGSIIFRAACAEGIYEADVRRVLLTLVKPGTWYFDIGANIGLLSLPVLANMPDVHVLSAEPSQSSLPFLKRTWEVSAWKDRWHLEHRAINDTPGEVTFSVAEPSMGAFEGMRDTSRAGTAREVKVPATTLDHVWQEQGRPRVSAVKIDIEGAETLALRGAKELIAKERPCLILEWNRMNLAAYEIPAGSLAEWAAEQNYIVRTIPGFIPVLTPQDLALQSLLGESFLLYPAERSPLAR
ncbi:MAG: FkbM family methyltransferase [Verrucomicrobiaceae bacterium]